MSKEVLIAPGVTRIRPDLKVIVTNLEPYAGVKPSETAYHEAEHIAPNPRNVRRATIHPGPGYLGLTELYEYNSIQAAAPHAKKRRGTGHDLNTLAARGIDINSTISAAGSVINSLDREVHNIAALLQIKGEISGYDAQEAANRANFNEAKVTIIGTDGNERSFISKVRRGEEHFIDIGLTSKAA